MARTVGRLALLVTAVGMGVGLAACHGGLHCGDTVTTSVTLTADLSNCPGDGLVIGANGVTVDLNGHTIDGTGAQQPVNYGSGTAGIRANERQNVTVFGGTIQGFDNGVAFLATSRSTVRDLDIVAVANGIRVVTGGFDQLLRNDVDGSDGVTGEAFLLIATNGNRVTSNTNRFNEFGSGIVLSSANFNTVTGNEVTGNDSPNIVLERSNANLIARNDASNSNTDGIYVEASNANRIEDNATDSEANGITVVDSDGNRLTGNDAGDGLSIMGSVRTVAAFNTSRAIDASGSENQILANRVHGGAFSEGILLTGEGGSEPSQVQDNLVTDGAGDGIRVDDPNVVVADNTALRNAGYGIRGVPAVTDGGGNTARGNQGPAQCLNIACT